MLHQRERTILKQFAASFIYWVMITVIGIFNDAALAEQASSYLLANEFKDEAVDLHVSSESTNNPNQVADFFNHLFDDEKQAQHFASLGRKGIIVTVHAISTREAQEAADVMNNHGAIDVSADANATETADNRSLMVTRVVDEDKRLKG